MPERSTIGTASRQRVLRQHVIDRRLRGREQRRVVYGALDQRFYRPNSGASSMVAI